MAEVLGALVRSAFREWTPQMETLHTAPEATAGVPGYLPPPPRTPRRGHGEALERLVSDALGIGGFGVARDTCI